MAFTLIEPGPVILVTTNDGGKPNVMTISWTMAIGFGANFAISTGPWNFSYRALETSRECVIGVPTIDMIDTIVGIGTCSGRDTNKFEKFGLTTLPAKHVYAPLIGECLANIECRVTEIIDRQNIVILEGVAAYRDEIRKEQRMVHAIGDGTFLADGRKFDRRAEMRSKLPPGV
ncbi:flavin reductase family protein [Sphingobium sp. CCH11-B1]|uniref:flavin reductase family protein n=1 Tax=Sphingobium sp. CCH11-B1 TaxID=1768781 RepID=UPI001E2EAD42|nr:flavin reductase family protein [Sphingobium sp. CCH11-B1]